MTIERVVQRPASRIYTRWTGDNLEELENHYGAEFTVTPEGELNLAPLNQEQTNVPVGCWFSAGLMMYRTDEEYRSEYQVIPDADIEYVFNDPS